MKLNKAVMDRIGMCNSIVCMVHCMITPLLLIVGFESVSIFLEQEWIELTIFLFAIVVGSISLVHGFFQHRQLFIPVLFIAGILLLINGESVIQEWLGIVLSVAGGLLILYAHYLNLSWKYQVPA